uniref:Low molecular weight glutenin subunit LMW.S1 n=1 Tax=Aegilops tauschii TaxID=37682 RepID=Q6J6V1_AEGTA|nr:low molecular weight glutenin subunit LMW.S1 precursor [Aegilops tauschii]AVY03600.1 low-molecular-weight glutenin subunit [Aegilops tauschii]
MKTFLVFALIAVVATSAIAQMETSCISGLERPWQQQPLPPQQSFSQQPPFSQQQQQQPLPQQPSFSQQQPPFSQQQPILSQQPPFSQQQQPVLPQQSPFSQQQQLVLPPQQQQQLVQQQIPIVQPSVLQQLNPCKVFLQQQCSPVAMPQRLARSQMWQQSSCHVMQQQCCQQLQQIPEQSRYEAIRAIIYSIILQEQQQGFVQPQQQQPQQSGQGVSQSQQQSQQQLGQCSFQQPQQQLGQQPQQQQQQQVLQGTFLQPHQIAHLEVVLSIALRTLPTMCSVNVPLYSATTSVPFGVGTGVGAY